MTPLRDTAHNPAQSNVPDDVRKSAAWRRLWRILLAPEPTQMKETETRDPVGLAADRIAGEDRPSREDLRAA